MRRVNLPVSALPGVIDPRDLFLALPLFGFQGMFRGARGRLAVDADLHGVPEDPGSGNPQKGGDPAAGSPTATLLRLSPSYRSYLRRLPPLRVGSATSGTPSFRGLTGGVYKAQEHIHRGVLIRDY